MYYNLFLSLIDDRIIFSNYKIIEKCKLKNGKNVLKILSIFEVLMIIGINVMSQALLLRNSYIGRLLSLRSKN